MANGRCYKHGGATPSGIASPHWKHGRHVRRKEYLPQRLWEGLEASLSDPDLLNLRTDIATLDTRIEDLLGRVDTGECGETWNALLAAVRELHKLQQKAEREEDFIKRRDLLKDCNEAVQTIMELCREGASDYAAWGEVISLTMLRAKMVDSETKRRGALKTDVPVEKVAAMLEELEARVNTDVKDQESRAAFSRILGELAETVGAAA